MQATTANKGHFAARMLREVCTIQASRETMEQSTRIAVVLPCPLVGFIESEATQIPINETPPHCVISQACFGIDQYLGESPTYSPSSRVSARAVPIHPLNRKGTFHNFIEVKTFAAYSLCKIQNACTTRKSCH